VITRLAMPQSRIYAPDILWTDDDVTRGRDALDSKDVELQAKPGGLQFVVDGRVYQTLGLGLPAFHLVKPGSDEPQVCGVDVAIVRNSAIVELDTVLTRQPG
jgi:hypothetical protein